MSLGEYRWIKLDPGILFFWTFGKTKWHLKISTQNPYPRSPPWHVFFAIPNILPSDLSKSVFNPYQLIPLCLHKFGCKKYDRGGLWISACIACHIIDFTCKSPIEYGCLVLCAVLCRQRAGAGWAAPVFKTIEPSSCNSNIVWNLYSVRSARFAISRSARLLNLVWRPQLLLLLVTKLQI